MSKADIYTQVTNSIITAIQAGQTGEKFGRGKHSPCASIIQHLSNIAVSIFPCDLGKPDGTGIFCIWLGKLQTVGGARMPGA